MMVNKIVSHSVLYLLLFIFGLPVPLHAEIEVETDRFDGTITVRTKVKAPTTRPFIALIGNYNAEGQLSIWLQLISQDSSWRYLKCNNTNWLVDDKPFQLPQPKHDGSVHSGFVVEFLIIAPIAIKQIEELAQAKKVEFKICNDEYTATPEEITDFRTFLTKLRESAPKKSP